MGSYVRTTVKNLAGPRRIPFIPPNGKFMHSGETVEIPGILDTSLFLGSDPRIRDLFKVEVATHQVEVKHFGVDGSGGGGLGDGVFLATLGDGVTKVFELDVGFNTALAQVFVMDRFGGGPIVGYSLRLRTPNDNSIRLEFDPAPPTDSIDVFIYES